MCRRQLRSCELLVGLDEVLIHSFTLGSQKTQNWHIILVNKVWELGMTIMNFNEKPTIMMNSTTLNPSYDWFKRSWVGIYWWNQ